MADGEGRVAVVKGLMSMVLAVQLGPGLRYYCPLSTSFDFVQRYGLWSLVFGVRSSRKIPLVLLSFLSR
jgi:hypothetical protein